MRTVRTLALAAALALAALVHAPARGLAQAPGSPQALEAAAKLVSLMSDGMIANLASQTTVQAWPSMEAAIRSGNPGIRASVLIEMRREFERLQIELTKTMMKDAPEIYARYFTAEELNELAAFYGTPTGAKALQMMPQAMGEVMSLAMPRMSEFSDQLDQAFQAVLKKHGLVKK